MDQRPVIAAVDGSENANRALEWAMSQALMAGAPLRIVHARLYASSIGSVMASAFEQPGQDDDPVLIRVRAALAGRTGLPVIEYASHPGTPDNVLPELGGGARMMVLGSRGRGGFASLLLGSNGLACASRAACPVVVVPRAEPPSHDPYGQVVLGLNSAAPDDGTSHFAFREASRRGARLQVVAAHAWPGPMFTPAGTLTTAAHDEAAAGYQVTALASAHLRPHRERFPGVDVEVVAAPGDAAGHLVAASQAADLIVIGRHRKRPFSPHLGSVTNAVLLHTACPAAVVPLEENAVPVTA
ncbi:universal stress protein [Streptomyces sp. NBC_00536]|uniref:universal stress protein n=1 Tax=Streptomyces sp. NBC_00536 TaxID=2975769 RepID=UPI002E8007D8|nr:universal stress protein [Streptomyces sp. NBC_00536]WUC78814.1 universal stress protein [Streptomyces sp. NBC_00536]